MQAALPIVLNADRKAEFLAVLADAGAELERLARSSEAEIESVSHAFKSLASQADTILQEAAAIVGCVEKESMGNVLASVQSLCLTVKDFLGRRLEAATTILGTLQEEEKSLLQLIRITLSQEAIARHLRALSVLTNVEVAHLGSTSGNFQLLAQELSSFSKSLTQQTSELACDTKSRQQTIAETRNELASSLPQLRGEMARMEDGIGKTLRIIDAGLNQQADVPIQFRRCAEQTARETAGVVAAIQAHDITRQQIEHVQQALQLIASRIASADDSRDEDLPVAYAGLKIQILQLKTIQETVANWTSQVRRCMEGIQQLSASGVVGIGPTVLRQERELSAELAHIELLQQKSQEYSARMQGTLSGLSSLVDLVNVHLKRSQMVRDRLQILMFNSLIEAQRLGGRGAAVSAIAGLIEEKSEAWIVIGNQSQIALSEILGLVERTTALMKVFSEASCQKLREEQAQTRAALDSVRSTAAFVANEATQMQTITENMHANLADVAATGTRLERCFGYLDSVLRQIEGLAGEWESTDPRAAGPCDPTEVERWLSAFYTTEIERTVMSAALHGTALPVVQQSFVGNAVELF
ncbi:MAG: hypothetical protein WBW38_18770 [Candidatus Sulfotelmatobacter sp.]